MVGFDPLLFDSTICTSLTMGFVAAGDRGVRTRAAQELVSSLIALQCDQQLCDLEAGVQ